MGSPAPHTEIEPQIPQLIATEVAALPVCAPGEVLRYWLVETGRSQVWLARHAGMSEHHLSRIINGHARFGPALAGRLETVTGLSATFLLHLQIDHVLFTGEAS